MRTANPDNIVRVENFLSSSELKEFKNFFNQEKTFTDPSIKNRSMITVNHSHEILDATNKYLDKVYEVISSYFGLDVVDFSGTCFRKWYPGEFQPPHSDCEASIYIEEDQVKCDSFYNFSSLFLEYAALCYINDDYEGGEIFFPDYNKIIKPSVNEFIFFPGTAYYMHGVKEVISGNRLVVQNFLTTTKILYIWKKLVQGKEDLNFIDYTQEEMMGVKREFNRSNIPSTCPHRVGE